MQTDSQTVGQIHTHTHTPLPTHTSTHTKTPLTSKARRTAALKVQVGFAGHTLGAVATGAGGAGVHLRLTVLACERQLAVALVVPHVVNALPMDAGVAGALVHILLAHLSCLIDGSYVNDNNTNLTLPENRMWHKGCWHTRPHSARTPLLFDRWQLC